jgi:hypothetical protein
VLASTPPSIAIARRRYEVDADPSGDVTPIRPNIGKVADFKSEWWPLSNRNGGPASNRNAGRLHLGMGGRIKSEFASWPPIGANQGNCGSPQRPRVAAPSSRGGAPFRSPVAVSLKAASALPARREASTRSPSCSIRRQCARATSAGCSELVASARSSAPSRRLAIGRRLGCCRHLRVRPAADAVRGRGDRRHGGTLSTAGPWRSPQPWAAFYLFLKVSGKELGCLGLRSRSTWGVVSERQVELLAELGGFGVCERVHRAWILAPPDIDQARRSA